MHIILFALLVYMPKVADPVNGGADKIEIEIVQPQQSSNLILPPKGGDKAPKDEGPGAGEPQGPEGDPLGEKLSKSLSINNYMERVKSIIDPIWYRLIKERMKIKRFYRTTSEVTITLSARGEILKRKTTKSSGRPDIDRIALEAFDRAGRLPPPPSNLLENNQLVLIWDFTTNSP